MYRHFAKKKVVRILTAHCSSSVENVSLLCSDLRRYFLQAVSIILGVRLLLPSSQKEIKQQTEAGRILTL
jgi:hypothetical protein